MNHVFLAQALAGAYGSLDTSPLQTSQRQVTVLDLPGDAQAMLNACASLEQEGIILVMPDPLGYSGATRKTPLVLLEQQGINPARIAWINLNDILVTARDGAEALRLLELRLRLAELQIGATKPYEALEYSPVRAIAVCGDFPDGADPGALPVEYQSVDPGKLGEVRGFPGAYQLVSSQDGEGGVVDAGGLVIFSASLEDEQRAALAATLGYPLLHGRMRPPKNRRQHRGGVFVVEDAGDYEAACRCLGELLDAQADRYYVQTARVDPERCGMCGTCVKTCMFMASSLDMEAGTSTIDPKVCVSCGNCVTACPTLARDLPGYTNRYVHGIFSRLEGFAGDGTVRILVFVCESNGYACINEMVDKGLRLPSSCLVVPIRCGARIESLLVAEALRAGFHGTAMLICARNECRNLVGSLDLERRLNLYRAVMKTNNIDPGRLRIIPVAEGRFEAVPAALDKFNGFLHDMCSGEANIFTF